MQKVLASLILSGLIALGLVMALVSPAAAPDSGSAGNGNGRHSLWTPFQPEPVPASPASLKFLPGPGGPGTTKSPGRGRPVR
jgi:hypothetical protein